VCGVRIVVFRGSIWAKLRDSSKRCRRSEAWLAVCDLVSVMLNRDRKGECPGMRYLHVVSGSLAVLTRRASARLSSPEEGGITPSSSLAYAAAVVAA